MSVASFAIIFFHSNGCLFILFIVSFAVEKLLSLIMSHLFIFVFISITLEGGSKRILLQFMSNSVLPMFSSKSFIVPILIFRSLIPFKFVFVYGVRKCSDFILLHVAVQWGLYWKEVCVFVSSMLTAGWKLASKGLWFSVSLADRCLLQCIAHWVLYLMWGQCISVQ